LDYQTVLSQLESLGTDQNRKTYSRHGVKEPMFGVSYANLDKLAKALKKDKSLDRTALAKQLWASGVYDARVLATKIADPLVLDCSIYDSWVLDLDNYGLADALSGLVGSSPYAGEKMEAWVDSSNEWISTAGWNMLGQLALQDPSLSDGFFEPYLVEIQAEIHSRPNRTRYAMNNALIAIGVRNHSLEQQALVVAGELGKVIVNHGQTSCQTPFAPDYIRKTWDYRAKKAAK